MTFPTTSCMRFSSGKPRLDSFTTGRKTGIVHDGMRSRPADLLAPGGIGLLLFSRWLLHCVYGLRWYDRRISRDEPATSADIHLDFDLYRWRTGRAASWVWDGELLREFAVRTPLAAAEVAFRQVDPCRGFVLAGVEVRGDEEAAVGLDLRGFDRFAVPADGSDPH